MSEEFTAYVRESFVALVENKRFPCLGARSAVRRDNLRFTSFPRLGGAADGLAEQLERFAADCPPGSDGLSSFVAAFEQPAVSSEEHFEELLWRQLQKLHEIDAIRHSWDSAVTSDPADPDFAFSVAGRAFFVVGMHPAASRWARRFSWPVLVFNPHDQFENLRADGRMNKLKATIRRRDHRLQGEGNPMLTDHGDSSAARQYSGRALDDEWRCPFTPTGAKA